MWARNLVFAGICVAGCGIVSLPLLSGTFRDERPLVDFDAGSIRATVARVDESFRQSWARSGIASADAADELAVARRISLGLTGTVPSLEEIRQFESWPQGERTQCLRRTSHVG